MDSSDNEKPISIDSTGQNIIKNAYELGLISDPNPIFYNLDDYYDFLESLASTIYFSKFDPQSDSDYKKLDNTLQRRVYDARDGISNLDKNNQTSNNAKSNNNISHGENVKSTNDATHNNVNQSNNQNFDRRNSRFINNKKTGDNQEPLSNKMDRFKQKHKRNDKKIGESNSDANQPSESPNKKDNGLLSGALKNGKKNDTPEGSNALKNAAKDKFNDTVKKAALSLFKNPYFWVFVIAIVAVVSLIFFIILFDDYIHGKHLGSLEDVPYVKMNFSEKVKVKIGDKIHELTLDEAAAAVTYHEVTGMTSSYETLKAQAIAARSRILYDMNQSSYKSKGYIESNGALGFSIASKNSKFMKAANDTHGIILVSGSDSNPSFVRVEWDALAIKCGGKETSDSFIIGQKNLEIPKSFLKKHFSFSNEWYQNRGKACHGRGMSQFGAYYLAVANGYDAKQILEYFYDNLNIISLYPNDSSEPIPESTGCSVLSNSIPITPSNVKEAKSSLGTILKSKGSSISQFNNNLLREVQKAGSGTRCAVVTAAVYTVKTLASYGVRIPYQMPAYKPTTYGLRSSWGKNVHHASSYHWKDKKGNTHTTWYNHLGLDCGTFIQWSFYNGGVKMGSQFKYKGKTVSLKEGKPGDVLYHGKHKNGNTGHVMLIIKYSSKKQGYYVAEASGSSTDVRITFKKLSKLKGYKVKDLSKYYCNKTGCGKSGTKTNAQLKKAYS